MRCHHCERPAIWKMGDKGPYLCLDCAERLEEIRSTQFLLNAAMVNMALDDMDAVAGSYGATPARIPVAALAQAKKGKTVLNNIHISNSNVGVLNTGDLARIDAVITLTKDTDAETIGEQLQKLTQAVIDTSELNANQKKEMLDLVQSLAEQVIRERKPSVMRALLKALKDPVQGVAGIVTIVDGLSALIGRAFGS